VFLKSQGYRALVICLCIIFICSVACAGEMLDVTAGRYDLLRAHNERVIVIFGEGVEFHRYRVVEFMNRIIAVTGAVRGGVRYSRHSDGGEETLLIE
jgi:hypothetical protein